MVMDNSREISSLRRRANKLAVFRCPPKLRLDVWHEGEEPPVEEPWQLRILIEGKVAHS